MRKTETVIKDLKSLINSKGYIYALCMILFEDFHINPEKIQEIDHRKRISTEEASLLGNRILIAVSILNHFSIIFRFLFRRISILNFEL